MEIIDQFMISFLPILMFTLAISATALAFWSQKELMGLVEELGIKLTWREKVGLTATDDIVKLVENVAHNKERLKKINIIKKTRYIINRFIILIVFAFIVIIGYAIVSIV